ncbi:MAG: hypothetical protein HYR84_09845 [Planctomycetes bacterium]|nr:hypothetical protein [Planctomycetota bacterium]
MNDADANSSTSEDYGRELEALGSILNALGPLPDNAREFVVRTAVARLKISSFMSDRKGEQAAAPTGGTKSDMQTGSLNGITPKEFLKMKKPASELQRIVCLAFYLTHAQTKLHFKTQDLTALNTEAAGGKFSNPSATVRNATNQSLFFAPGPKGTKQITALGEDFVNALPDQDAAKAVVLQNKPKGVKRRPTAKE